MAIKAHIIRCTSYLLLLVAGTVMAFFGPEAPTKVSHPATAGLSFAERVSYQRAIEDVYWRHRIWPKENLNPKPSLDAVMSQAQLEQKVEDYLLNSQAVEDYYKGPLSAEQLQAEMERMARHTKQPEVLRELFEALGNDPFVIAECLARPALSERMTTSSHVTQTKTALLRPKVMAGATANYTLPKVSDGGNRCTDDTWTPTSIINAPDGRQSHTTVWTGSEMIIWGGGDNNSDFGTGGRYNPSTDSWTPTSTVNAPDDRIGHKAVWTGTEMIVWGGLTQCCPIVYLNTGGSYNPSTDSWVATTTTGAPDGRFVHTAVWTGTEMIVWGGSGTVVYRNGGRYNPNTDSWTDTSNTNAPSARYGHTAVWTDSEMILWGGTDGFTSVDTGGRYNPISDTWTATNITNAPAPRNGHRAVWTGTEMIVWSGSPIAEVSNTGGRYNPSTDSWMATSTVNAPSARVAHTAVWTGSEMIVWGGYDGINYFNTGGRYNPIADSWVAPTTTDAPNARAGHAGVWTGNEMIVWGGLFVDINGAHYLKTGGRYCAESGPTPTPTPTPTPGPFTLSAQKKKVQGINTVRLTWSGATSTNIDVYRDGVLITTTANDGSYDDSTGETGEAEYLYRVCEAGTQSCSNEVLVRFAQNGRSATWSMNPVSGDWNDRLNWTPNTVPHGPSGTATFDVSNITDVSLSDAILVGAIVFNAAASPFTITCPKELTIDGAGITNNSGVTQNFVSTVSSQPIRFVQSASAGNQTTFTNSHGYIEFRDTANPGTATFVTSNGGITIFFDQAKSDNGTFIANSGGTTYPDFHHGANGTCISNPGGTTYLGIGDRAGNATFIANGGEIIFDAFSNGDTARVEIFGNGLLYTADSFDLTLGSIEGDGIIELGDDGLKVGSNNLSTVFAGQIRDTNSEIFGATLVKEGSGSLTLSSRNLYRNGTVVLDGTLVINNTTGSGTGAGAVQVNQGILAGSGIISGAVTVGTGGGAGAFLAPGKGSSTATTLTIQSTVTFKADSIYTYRLNTKSAEADQVVAHGVTIESGAQFDFVAVANKRLTPGTVFTAISNTSANPISGVFANLPDDSTFTVGRNTFQADYQGGDGNDLTLTVVP